MINVTQLIKMDLRKKQNEGVGARTQDLRLKRPLLYQLSYTSEQRIQYCKDYTADFKKKHPNSREKIILRAKEQFPATFCPHLGPAFTGYSKCLFSGGVSGTIRVTITGLNRELL